MATKKITELTETTTPTATDLAVIVDASESQTRKASLANVFKLLGDVLDGTAGQVTVTDDGDGTFTLSLPSAVTDKLVANGDSHDHSGGDGAVVPDGGVANDLTISGGVIDNTIIGGTTPAAGTFTTLKNSEGVVSAPVGIVQAYIGSSAPTNWLLLNGDTIGDTGSGADHAGADYEELFELFWNSMADSEAAVSSGRGASAQADWDAGKTLTMPNAKGRSIIGTGTGSGLTARTHGDTDGAETHTLTEAEMPSHTHAYTAPADVESVRGAGSLGTVRTTSPGQTSGSAGSGDAHNNMPPWLALNWIVKYK